MIKDWVGDLMTLTDEDWSRYAFNRDPFVARIPRAGQLEYCQKAMSCGVEQAQRLRKEDKTASPESLARQMDLNLLFKEGWSDSGYTLFACYEEPRTITIFVDNSDATDELVAENGLNELIGNAKAADLLIAHELYHYLEQSLPNVYTAQKRIALWKLGPFENRSKILCLAEIGAMAFTKELVGLECSPYLFNVLMLLPGNPQKAKKLYETIMRFKDREKVQP